MSKLIICGADTNTQDNSKDGAARVTFSVAMHKILQSFGLGRTPKGALVPPSRTAGKLETFTCMMRNVVLVATQFKDTSSDPVGDEYNVVKWCRSH